MAWPGTATTIPVLWIVVTTLLTKVDGTGMFELHLESFRNDLGVNNNGDCCAGIRQGGQCSSPCRTFFTICLKQYQAHINVKPPCTFGSVITPVIGANSFTFPDTIKSFSNPLRLPFDFAWPGDFTLIIDAWHDKTLDGPSQNSPREEISQLAIQRSVSVGSEWDQNLYSTNSTDLRYSYRVVCDDNYYGDDCSEICKPRDDQFGHYSCGEQGEKVCLEGWKGTYCDEVICLPGCHSEHGFCSRPNECQCHNGWKGKFCDQCIAYPGCLHGTCNDTPWSCECREGWGGLFCNQDLNYCTHNRPCKNGATCTNTGEGGYTCTCHSGYTGNNCEIEIDDCLHQPCLNGGNCTDTGKDYTCRCPHGFHGRHCESSATSCEESPCRNGAVCTPQDTGYKCSCTPGYTGINCESEINECAPSPCQNGGSCVDDLNGFHCVCRAGYSGDKCQINRNDCTLNPCQNGATCLDRVNDFECRCAPGFVGDLCELDVNDCETKPCANGGTCQDRVNDFSCMCSPGFTGKDCRHNIDDCAAQPCLNGGSCTDWVNDYDCSCRPGFHGKNCQLLLGQTTPRVQTSIVPVGPSAGPGKPEPVDASPTPAETQVLLTTQQLLLIICLGIGIPCIVCTAVIIFIVCNRRRHRQQDSATKDNEQNEVTNMNNKNKSLDPSSNIIHSLSSTSQTLKVTNEELGPHRKKPVSNITSATSSSTNHHHHHHLNVDKPSCTINKNYLKDNINKHTRNKELLEVHKDYKRPPAGQLMDYSNQQDRGRPLRDPHLPDPSDYCSGDLHIVKPINTEPHPQGSIFFLDHHHTGHPYSEGMLATEV